jgi:hypothetical protein
LEIVLLIADEYRTGRVAGNALWAIQFGADKVGVSHQIEKATAK